MTFNNTGLIIAMIILVVLGLGGGYLIWSRSGENTIHHLPGKTIMEKDTIYSIKSITKEKIIPVFTNQIIEVERADSDTSGTVLGEMVKTDTFYVASLDTTLFDSLLNLSVKYNSQIPLDQKGYFSLQTELKERNVIQKETIFVESEPGIINKWIHFGLVAAAGYGTINKKHDVFIGLGVMIGL